MTTTIPDSPLQQLDPDPGDDHPDLSTEFVEMNARLREDADLGAAMSRLVRLAVRAVPACDAAAVSVWPRRQEHRNLAASDEMAATAARLQRELGEGPALTAVAPDLDEAAVLAPDLARDPRWPRWSDAVRALTPVRGVVAYEVSHDPHPTTLTFYSRIAGALDDGAVELATVVAAHARVLLMHAAASEQALNLKVALSRSRQIGAATGVLMAVHKVTADDAFQMLRTSSQHLNRKLFDVADDVTETGALPVSSADGSPAR